jgi:proteasome lid subunit RPN8/RPN11
LLAGRLVTDVRELTEVPDCTAVEYFPLVNAAASPVEFLSDPRSMFNADRQMRRAGLDVLAVYHSHPISAPVPSRKDLERNYSPQVMNLILSLMEKEIEMRAWWLSEAGYEPGEWEYIEEEG